MLYKISEMILPMEDNIVKWRAQTAYKAPTKKPASSTRGKKSSNSDRIAVLGIPQVEMTQAVTLAVSALLEKLDDMSHELARTKDTLAELEQLVDVDCVAPIPNRRAFMRRLNWTIAMHERYNHPSSILYFDLNNFKEINDNHGHAAGDMAIRQASKVLMDTMRESDFLARIGGDEFAVIMYYADGEAAKERGRKIAEKIQSSPIMFNGKSISLSTAHGTYALQSGDNAEDALSSADMAMYIDKKRLKEAATDVKA